MFCEGITSAWFTRIRKEGITPLIDDLVDLAKVTNDTIGSLEVPVGKPPAWLVALFKTWTVLVYKMSDVYGLRCYRVCS